MNKIEIIEVMNKIAFIIFVPFICVMIWHMRAEKIMMENNFYPNCYAMCKGNNFIYVEVIEVVKGQVLCHCSNGNTNYNVKYYLTNLSLVDNDSTMFIHQFPYE